MSHAADNRPTNESKEPEMETIELKVPGMTCGHCESAVRSELAKVAGIEQVDVDLASKDVRVIGSGLDRAALVAAIDEAGFDVAP